MADGDERTARDGISRRDFLDGVAITAAGLAAAAASPTLTGAEAAVTSAHDRWWPEPPKLPPGYYPPTQTGLKGQPDNVLEKIYRIDGRPDVRAAAAAPVCFGEAAAAANPAAVIATPSRKSRRVMPSRA